MKNARRGRPKGFVEGEAIEQMLGVFWTKGYEATSLDDISAATRIARPSLFLAFGNKEAMFIRALDHYIEQRASEFKALQEEGLPLRELLLRHCLSQIDLYVSGASPRGCALFCAAVTASTQNAAIRAITAKKIESIEATFTEVFRAAQGSLGSSEPAALASELLSLIMGLSLRARAGVARAELEQIARRSLALWLLS